MSETPSNFDQPDREPTVHEQDKQRSHITQALSFIEQGFTLPEIKNVSVDPYFVFSERFLKDEMNKFTLEQWNSFKKEISILLARSKTIITQLRTYIGNKGDFKPDESEINDSDVVGRTTYIFLKFRMSGFFHILVKMIFLFIETHTYQFLLLIVLYISSIL